MELDVHIMRAAGEPWGFELVGGVDSRLPLTVDKVLPSSPASRAGLQAGDVVARLGDRLAPTRADAEAAVAESVASLSLGICRGLYDPVLDDFEPIYEPTDRADSDLRSEPTEVGIDGPNDVDLSLDDPNILDPNITDPSLWDSGYATRPLTEMRSSTTSPFVPNLKPYRPFSTEPIEVPLLDDPIILNPYYKDSFNLNLNVNNKPDPKEDELIRLLPLDRNVEAKFKLPVSEKYDPDWDKKVRALVQKCVVSEQRDSQQIEHELASYSDRLDTSTDVILTKEISNMKTDKQVIIQESLFSKSEIKKEELKCDDGKMSIKKIEQAALDVVDESIKRAVSVTEEIQSEIEEERASMVRELQVEGNKAFSEIETYKNEVQEKEKRNQSESVRFKTETSNKSRQESEVNETEQISEKSKMISKKVQETVDVDEKSVEDKKLSNKKAIEEIIETSNVRKKTSDYEKQNTNISESTSARTAIKQAKYFEKYDETNKQDANKKTHQAEKTETEQTREYKSSGKYSKETSNPEDKQKAFMIGLQTIPHIKGFVQSSYHFDLLLRTFFVHLTDVMVALSRFILTQPTQELEVKAEKVVKEKLIKEFAEQDNIFERKETGLKHKDLTEMQSVKENKLQDIKQVLKAKQSTKSVKNEMHKEHEEYRSEIQETQSTGHENKMKLKQEMSQEFVTKNQEDMKIDSDGAEIKKKSGAEMAQRTQKKSRDLTEKMDAVITEFENKTGIEERIEVTEHRKERSRSQIEDEVMSESDPLEWLEKADSKKTSQERYGTNVEKEFPSFSKYKESNITEFKCEHRTDKVKPDKQMYVAIVESHVYTNEDAILQEQAAEISETASEEIDAALESSETISKKNAMKNNVIKAEEKQQAVEVITNALQEKQEVVEEFTDLKSHFNEQHTKAVMQKSHVSTAAESNVTTLESEELLKVIDSKETKPLAVQEEAYETAAETTEIVDESILQSFKTKETIYKQATVSSEENYKTAAENITDLILETSKEELTKYTVKGHQAVSKVESLAIAVAESTDVVVDDSKLETFENQEPMSKKALEKFEDTFKTAAEGVTEVTFETAEEKHSERAKTNKVTVKEESQHLAVAGIIETKANFCKESKQPAQDEYTSLKIIKEQSIDVGGSLSSESEHSIKKSVEVDITNSQHSIYQSNYQALSQESKSVHSLVQEMSNSVQESSISIQESNKSGQSLHLDTNLARNFQQQISDQSEANNNTPTPTKVTPTPLTDEYVFKLEIPLPKNQKTVIVEDSPDREDPHIVKKGLIPYIETTIDDQIIYDPPLPTPPEDKPAPVYNKPGLKGGSAPLFKKEYIREIERKSSLLASAIDETIKSIEEYKEEVGIDTTSDVTLQLSKNNNGYTELSKPKTRKVTIANGLLNGHEEINKKKCTENGVTENHQELSDLCDGDKESDVPPGFKPVSFNPEEYRARLYEEVTRRTEPAHVELRPYLNESGEPLGTVHGIVDGLEDATVDEKVAKELGKPGLTEEKIAELISGESEMLREAHVMGLTRVLTSHMTRPDDSSVDFQKIKPLYDSLKHSEVLKALNEEIKRESELKKKKEGKNWTTFLQKPKRPVPKVKLGYNGNAETEDEVQEPYKVKIVKQPKPKVAPDYKPEDFDTGPLPWEQRALNEPIPSPIPPEEPILVPEEAEFFEAVDPLPESEVPDLEDTGIPLPATPPPTLPEPTELPPEPEPPSIPEPEPVVEEEPPPKVDMDQNSMAEQLVNTVKGMVDPNAPLEQQLCQMRAQLAALAQLPCVIQQSLELLTRQLSAMGRQETQMNCEAQMNVETVESHQEIHENTTSIQEFQEQSQNNEELSQNNQEVEENKEQAVQDGVTLIVEKVQAAMTAEEAAASKREQDALIEEQRKSEKEKKEREEKIRFDQESRQVKQRAPRVGKPRPVFGPPCPQERPLVLPGGRRWRGPKDAYNDQFIAETIQAQSEIIQGKVMGINFMKYEKPPVSLDHLQNSATYKLIHNMEDAPLKRTDLLTPVVAESDYRERCRSATPNMQANGRM